MKLGIIVDSSAGLSKKEADKRGWGFLPLIMTIDGKEYRDGIDIEAVDFYKMIDIKMDVRTSATPPGIIIDEFEKASKKYDYVIVYGLSTGLSSQTNNLKTFAKEFNNIHVIDSKSVGYATTYQLENAEIMFKEGKGIEEIISHLEMVTSQEHGLLIPETMRWLIKGGRITGAAAKLGNLLNIIPIISFKDGILDKHGKGRVLQKAAKKAAGFLKEHYPENEFIIYDGTDDKKVINAMREYLGDVPIHTIPPVIAIHTGPSLVAIMSFKK